MMGLTFSNECPKMVLRYPIFTHDMLGPVTFMLLQMTTKWILPHCLELLLYFSPVKLANVWCAPSKKSFVH